MLQLLVPLTHLPTAFFLSLLFEDSENNIHKLCIYFLCLSYFVKTINICKNFYSVSQEERGTFLCSPAKVNETHQLIPFWLSYDEESQLTASSSVTSQYYVCSELTFSELVDIMNTKVKIISKILWEALAFLYSLFIKLRYRRIFRLANTILCERY